MDTTTFFTIVIVLIALVLVGVGAYLVLVLHEARQSFRRINHILDHAESIIHLIDEKIARPAGSLVGIFAIIKEGLELFKKLKTQAPEHSGKEAGNKW